MPESLTLLGGHLLATLGDAIYYSIAQPKEKVTITVSNAGAGPRVLLKGQQTPGSIESLWRQLDRIGNLTVNSDNGRAPSSVTFPLETSK